jgi:ABC-type Fe3+/spermidine/putrescine transport system ATPase subunit
MLVLKGLSKTYPKSNWAALDSIDLQLPSGNLLSLIGPSGSGKSTLLQLIAGLAQPDAGQISWQGQDWLPLPPQKRQVGLVFQDYALFPHLNVFENVAYGLRVQGKTGQLTAQVQHWLARVGLAGFERRLVQQLSGGEQQRVALARALAPQPRLLLLDEPFGALDAALRLSLGVVFREILQAVGQTAILVTHDQTEALALSDQVAVLAGGRLLQVASPVELYQSPVNAWVARFLGQPNILSAVVAAAPVGGTAWQARLPFATLPLRVPAHWLPRPTQTILGALSPWAATWQPQPDSDPGSAAAQVQGVLFRGDVCVLSVLVASTPADLAADGVLLQVLQPGDAAPPALGALGWLKWRADAALQFLEVQPV